MKLSSLHIDRFGARTDLKLADFTDQLNVVYGPNGAGKTTIIQFIRWMIFGDRDEISRRYLTTSSGPAYGSMIVRDPRGQHVLERKSQYGSMLSQLTVGGQNESSTLAPLGISNAEFDRFFVVSFDQSRNIADLLNSAKLHGLQLHIDQRRVEHARQLRDQIDRHRTELDRFGYLETQEQLVRLRDEQRREIESLRQEFLQRQEKLQQLRNQISLELSDPKIQVDRLRSVVSNIDQAIETRNRQLTEEHEQWRAAQHELDERRHRRFAEIEGQLHRWQDILSEVRSRLEQVRSRIAAYSNVSASRTDAADLQLFMRQLGFRIRDIEQDLTGVYESESWRDHEADASYLRGLLGSALSSMQSDIARLGQTVERQQQVNELHETREELNYLCRVEQELSDLIDALGRQRHQLGRDPAISDERSFVSSQPDEVLGYSVPATLRYPSSNQIADPRYVLPTVKSPEYVNGLDDFRLRHLADRRESAMSRLHQAELELANCEQRLRGVDDELARLGGNERISQLEREISEIDGKLRQREQRSALERTIADLDDQWRRLSEHHGTSQVIHRASEMLQRLTENEFTKIDVSADHRCQVTGNARTGDRSSFASAAGGHAYDYGQLSRGVQDQVYLAVGLAIVEALRAKGASAPLILNDVFGNLDQSGTRALAQVLSEFAARDHQCFVFTRHDHIRDLFQSSAARIFTLREDRPRIIVTPPVASYVPQPKPVRPVYDSAADLTPPPSPSYKWVAEWQGRETPSREFESTHLPVRGPFEDRSYPSLDVGSSIEEQSIPMTPQVAKIEVHETTLSLNSPLAEVAVLGDEFLGYMQRLDLHRVEEFLAIDPNDVEKRLGDQGVTSDVVQRRQRETTMIVYMGTSVSDAQLLVACGVPDPARLARADEAVLLKRVETILSRPQAVDRFGTIDRYGMARVRKWIELARNSSFPGRSRRSFRAESPTSVAALSSSRSTQTPSSSSNRSQTKRRERTTREAQTVQLSKPEGLRFYLEPQDPVVDAPSIGPKTAEKLSRVDVLTVSQLLAADPARLAERLNEKRFSAEVIEQWQLQAELVCCIPNLRGHDAQILVGCGVEDPITLSSMDASSFLLKVMRFVESKEGQRAIRNAKKPDLAEVTAWIEWSESARQLRAA